jgi:ADP-heptose:LPS heptosyltransferase
MIINASLENFGGVIRNGDLIALSNIVEYLRQSNPHTKFYLKPGTLSTSDYCQKFFQFLLNQTDYFSSEPGNVDLHWKKVNIWDFRDISGDLVSIPNGEQVVKNKIVIFPVFDAQYNVYRNWPKNFFDGLINHFNQPIFEHHEKILCHHVPLNVPGWKDSTDFIENIHHIMNTETFIGGDTGTSHFAWSLERSPPNLIYYSSSRELLHTLPFYILKGKGELRTYWLDFEGSQF